MIQIFTKIKLNNNLKEYVYTSVELSLGSPMEEITHLVMEESKFGFPE